MADITDKDTIQYPSCPEMNCSSVSSDGSVKASSIDNDWNHSIEMYYTSDIRESFSNIDMRFPTVFATIIVFPIL